MRMEEKTKEMEEALNRALQVAESERARADHHLNLLLQTTNERDQLRAQVRAMEDAEKRWWANTPIEPMEVVEVVDNRPPSPFPIATPREIREEGKRPPLPTEEERRANPIRRPALKGKVKIVEDRPIDIMTETNERGERAASPLRRLVSGIAAANRRTLSVHQQQDGGVFDDREVGRLKRKKKWRNQLGPNWGEMELCSTSDPEVPPSLEEVVGAAIRRYQAKFGAEDFPPLPPPKGRKVAGETPAPKPAPRNGTTAIAAATAEAKGAPSEEKGDLRGAEAPQEGEEEREAEGEGEAARPGVSPSPSAHANTQGGVPLRGRDP